ncbi:MULTISPECIES: matrixin family metalloprotease [Sinorhizobium]|uniref:matrixin family metalloprotease n=1 Tax=Sinorhizobium TaxID=28105 RepID=UPI0011AC3EF3|nr:MULTISPECIES: matrixin family metalloprotease [Sinorhizobium]TWA50561.1 matrixin [Sinorhizobium medicae]
MTSHTEIGKFARGVLCRTSALSTVMLFLITATPASAYKWLEMDWSYQANPVETHFVVCENDAPVGASARIKEAAAKWNYTKLKFVFDEDDCPAQTPKNYVVFDTFPQMNAAVSDTKNVPATNKMTGCVIHFNKNRFWYVGNGTPDADENDLFSVALHEFGHCLGLDHVGVNGVVMQEKLDAGKQLRQLTPDDIAGRNNIYGSP